MFCHPRFYINNNHEDALYFHMIYFLYIRHGLYIKFKNCEINAYLYY